MIPPGGILNRWTMASTTRRRAVPRPATTGTPGHSVAMFRDKFWLSLLLTIPVVILSPDVQEWFGYTAPAFPGSTGIRGGHPRDRRLPVRRGSSSCAAARAELADRRPGMMTLISLAILVAFVTLVGRDARPVRGRDLVGARDPDHDHAPRPLARDALDRPGARGPRGPRRPSARPAERVTRDRQRGPSRSPSSSCGDVVLVRPGGRVPADGVDRRGHGRGRRIDDHRRVAGGARGAAAISVIAGTVAAGGVAAGPGRRGRATATALSGIMRLVAAAQASGSRAQALADRAAALLFYVAVRPARSRRRLVGRSAIRKARSSGRPRSSSSPAPTRSGLAIPLVIAISTSLGARNGLLVKDRVALERARRLDTVIFDKTGHADQRRAGRRSSMRAGDADAPPARGGGRGRLGAPAGDGRSWRRARDRGLAVPTATGFEALAGRGARARVDGSDVAVGGPRLLADIGARGARPRSTPSWERGRPHRPPRRCRPAESSAPSPSRTRSVPSRRERSIRCTSWGSGSR